MPNRFLKPVRYPISLKISFRNCINQFAQIPIGIGQIRFLVANTNWELGKSDSRQANTCMYLGKSDFWWQIHICIWANQIPDRQIHICIWANRFFGGKYIYVFGRIGFQTSKYLYVFGQIRFLVANTCLFLDESDF